MYALRAIDIGDVIVPTRPAPRRCRTHAARPRAKGRAGGFSMIEVVLVIVILGVVAAIAIPRLSRGSQGTADTALARDLQLLQKAIDLYAAEHNGAFPQPTTIASQLTQYTDSAGAVSAGNAPPFNFGPYVRKIPAVPTGPNKGNTGIAGSPGGGVGWIYDSIEGTISVNNTPPPVTANPPLAATTPADDSSSATSAGQ